MNWIARFVFGRVRTAWVLTLVAALAVGVAASQFARFAGERERASLLQTEAQRRSIELMSQTLNGIMMGAMSILGLSDAEIKLETVGQLPPNTPRLAELLASVGRSYDAEGVFIVGEDGVVSSAWDNTGKNSTGLNVKFRPYYLMAMQGIENVYAAVSLTTGRRAVYFSAPVFVGRTKASAATGAMVIRSGLAKVDNLLKGEAEIALLLSPQGVVFASNQEQWVGQVAGALTSERIKAINDLKQFGNMFEKQSARALPFGTEPGVTLYQDRRYAVERAKVNWNDPYGDWTVVLLEDLSRSLPLTDQVWIGAASGAAFWLVTSLFLLMLGGHYRQALASEQLAAYSRAQQVTAERKTRLAGAAMRMQQAKDPAELAQIYFAEANRILGALQGVVYVFDQGSTAALHLAGSYACAGELPAVLAPGEGLLGQCAVERRSQIVATAPEGFATIRSGLGETRPAAVMMAPILLNEALLGVAEIAVLTRPGEPERDQFEEMTGLLAMNLEILGRSVHTEEMLTATMAAEQANAERLTFQQALVDTIPYPVFYKGADTRFLGFNRAYEETFKIRRETLIGKRVLDLDYLPEADRLAYQAEDEATIASAGSVRREMKMPFADGKVHDTLYFVSGFRRQDGSPGGLVGTFIDISAIKDAEREMERFADVERFNRLAQGREQRIVDLKREVNALAESTGQAVRYATTLVETVGDHDLDPHPDYRTTLTAEAGKPLKLDELVDLEELQTLFSSFCESVGIAAAIIDLEANVLASSRWQPACTKFHRINPESCARCIESDTELAVKLQDGQDFTMYKCKNGMTDCASPIIVEGQHLANVFIGQFHLGPPDLEFFRKQAQQFGYPEAEYLQAIAEAPVADEKRLPVILGFLTGFARMVSTMSLARRRADEAQQLLQQQAELLKRERVAAMSLAEDAEQARRALEMGTREGPT